MAADKNQGESGFLLDFPLFSFTFLGAFWLKAPGKVKDNHGSPLTFSLNSRKVQLISTFRNFKLKIGSVGIVLDQDDFTRKFTDRRHFLIPTPSRPVPTRLLLGLYPPWDILPIADLVAVMALVVVVDGIDLYPYINLFLL